MILTDYNAARPLAGSEKSTTSHAQQLLTGTMSNGLAFAEEGDILITNFGTDRLERMTRSENVRVVLDHLDGQPLGKVNFVLHNRLNRVWISVSTTINPWSKAISSKISDGSIILIDSKGPRVVADGFHFTNEMRLDSREEWLYVAETTAKRITRLWVQANNSLVDRETYGPADLGPGLGPDLSTVYLGGLRATSIPYFKSPVPGLPMAHWVR